MKRIYAVSSIFVFTILISYNSQAQQKKTETPQLTKLTSNQMVVEGKELDKQILELNKKLQDVIIKHKLATVRDIGIVPYRVTYNLGDNFLEIEKYDLKRDPLVDNTVIGIKEKKVKIFFSGQNISKIESYIKDKDVGREGGIFTKILDPSPTQEGTDDMIFSHSMNNLDLVKDKKLGDIRNNRAFPVRNEIKREFIIPHSAFIYNTILKIAELYSKGIKDSDNSMADFLRKSTAY